MSNVLQQNPALDKVGLRLGRAGSGILSPILKGFRGKLTLPLATGEVLTSWSVAWDGGSHDIYAAPPVYDSGTNTWTYELVFGTATGSDATATGKKNTISWTTTLVGETGTYQFQRQFWVKDVPGNGALYINNQEAVDNEAIVYADFGTETDEFADKASLSFNILPTVNDEFFAGSEYVANRYANTRRNWGGAVTCEVAAQTDPAGGYSVLIAETNVEDVMGFFWTPSSAHPIASGLHNFRFRLRSKTLSANVIDIVGNVLVRQVPC